MAKSKTISKQLPVNILNYIQSRSAKNEKMIAVLIDPDKCDEGGLDSLVNHPAFEQVDLLFVGGSIVNDGKMQQCLSLIKSKTDKTCVIFPGNPNQIDEQAEGILFLSLVSGRNPDLLIGKQVESALRLKQSSLEVIPTAYLLLDGGKVTAVSYVSNTTPIPQDKPDIAVSTALAGQLLGQQLIYMDNGSGALWHADEALIRQVKEHIDIPLIVGGGIRSKEEAENVFQAGADVVVVGNKLEEDPQFLEDLVVAKHLFRTV